MFMIAEAVDDTGLQTFMAPFREAGSVDVVPIDADTARAFLENLLLLGALERCQIVPKVGQCPGAPKKRQHKPHFAVSRR